MEREGKRRKKAAFKMCELTTISSSLDISKESTFSAEYAHAQSQRISSKPVEGNHPAGASGKLNQVGAVMLFGVPIVSLVMDGKERLCLAQISSTLLKDFSYNEIHNRRVALGITCIQCTPVQLEILRRAGAMPVTSRRCGMITRREAERLCQSFLGDHAPPQLPENFSFDVAHFCAWGCRGAFVPSRYNSSRAKCIRCSFCQLFFSPNKFIFHSHRLPDSRYVQPDAANFNSWRRHLKLCGDPPEEDYVLSSGPLQLKDVSLSHKSADNGMPTAQIVHAWEDVKAMFNGGTRKRLLAAHTVVPVSAGTQMKRNSHSMSLKLSPPHHSAQGNGNNNSSRAATPQSRQSNFHQTHSGQHNHTQHPCDNRESTAPGFISPISGINVTAPLLSPASIWNPGISPVAGRQFPIGNPMPPLPLSIHPLSIPWLRRPLFPFSHPFGPTCKFLGESGGISQEASGNSSGTPTTTIRPGSSAFKPVGQQRSPTHEHLFTTWLTNAGLHGNASLPEDLSLNSGNSSNNSSCSPILAPTQSLESDRSSKSNIGNVNGCLKTCHSQNDKRSVYINTDHISPTAKEEPPCKEAEEVVSSSSSSSRSPDISQLQSVGEDKKVTGNGEESMSDDENVDIESTDNEFWRAEPEESISRMSVWEMESMRHGRKRALEVTEQEVDVEDDEVDNLVRDTGSGQSRSNNHQRNRTTSSSGLKRKKRLWDFDARCNHLD